MWSYSKDDDWLCYRGKPVPAWLEGPIIDLVYELYDLKKAQETSP